MKSSPKPWQSLHNIWQMAVYTHWWASLLNSSVLTDDNLNQKLHIKVYRSLLPLIFSPVLV